MYILLLLFNIIFSPKKDYKCFLLRNDNEMMINEIELQKKLISLFSSYLKVHFYNESSLSLYGQSIHRENHSSVCNV